MMELFETMETRSSRRAFLPRPVEKAVLERLIAAANRSPSYQNTQPWEMFVATGEKKDAVAARMRDSVVKGTPMEPHIPFARVLPKAHEARALSHRNRRFQALGIDPEKDQERITESYMKNFMFFGAPCVIFVGMDKTLPPWSIFDLGAFVHGFLLAAHAAGLGAVPQAMPTGYPAIVREELGIPEEIAIILAMSVGYPDLDAPVNGYRSLRREPGEFVRWIGF
jgi:nitroreductase